MKPASARMLKQVDALYRGSKASEFIMYKPPRPWIASAFQNGRFLLPSHAGHDARAMRNYSLSVHRTPPVFEHYIFKSDSLVRVCDETRYVA